jgi:hypothetical protein
MLCLVYEFSAWLDTSAAEPDAGHHSVFGAGYSKALLYDQIDILRWRTAMRPSVALQANRAAIRCVVEQHRACNARVFGSVLHGDDLEGSAIHRT